MVLCCGAWYNTIKHASISSVLIASRRFSLRCLGFFCCWAGGTRLGVVSACWKFTTMPCTVQKNDEKLAPKKSHPASRVGNNGGRCQRRDPWLAAKLECSLKNFRQTNSKAETRCLFRQELPKGWYVKSPIYDTRQTNPSGSRLHGVDCAHRNKFAEQFKS